MNGVAVVFFAEAEAQSRRPIGEECRDDIHTTEHLQAVEHSPGYIDIEILWISSIPRATQLSDYKAQCV